MIVFESDASDIVPDPNGDGIDNNATDIYALDTDSQLFSVLSLTEDLKETNGPSWQPTVSKDGKVAAFVSSASNMKTGLGISVITVENGGGGYFGNPTIIVTDNNNPPIGTGAILSLQNGIDKHGQILPEGVTILNSGRNYIDPVVTILADPNQPPPLQQAIIKAHLTHPWVISTEWK